MASHDPGKNTILLMSSARIERSIGRMAYQIAEDCRGEFPIVVVGIKERGFAVARKLAGRLRELSTAGVALIQRVENQPALDTTQLEGVAKESVYLILVDDVIFTGQTMLETIAICREQFDPEVFRTAVLVDRGHRTVPVEATFAGLNLPTKPNEHVHVIVDDAAIDKVILTKS